MRRHKGLISDRSQALLIALGENIDVARKRRRLQIDTICTRAGITKQTYSRLKKGESGISVGVLMNVLSALDLEEMIGAVASPEHDEVGMTLERAQQPSRVREGVDVDGKLDPNW
jgi:transcriptional regulator with XRE-family HTH domain